MGGLVLAFALTGYLLPWDQKGYWATQVATGIMGSVPGGEPLSVSAGRNEYGNLTLTRFYTLHVFVLPIGARGAARHPPRAVPQARRDAAGAAARGARAQDAAVLPDAAVLDVSAMALTSVFLVLLTSNARRGARRARRSPRRTSSRARSGTSCTLFQLLKYFEGPLQLIATVIIPGAVTTFLVLLPWIDRAQSRKVGERMPVVAAVALLMTGVVTLTSLAMVEDSKNEKFQKARRGSRREEAERARELREDRRSARGR